MYAQRYSDEDVIPPTENVVVVSIALLTTTCRLTNNRNGLYCHLIDTSFVAFPMTCWKLMSFN